MDNPAQKLLDSANKMSVATKVALKSIQEAYYELVRNSEEYEKQLKAFKAGQLHDDDMDTEVSSMDHAFTIFEDEIEEILKEHQKCLDS